MDLFRVERGDQVLVLLALVRATQIDHDFDQLARASCEDDRVLLGRQ